MKPIIKYISLLLAGGLILIFGVAIAVHALPAYKFFGADIQHIYASNQAVQTFSFWRDVASDFIPLAKILN